MAINISEARVQQVIAVVDKFTNGFAEWSDSNRQEDFLAILDENIAWYDHGFHAVRIGHEAVLGLHKGFLYGNQPFKAENLSVLPTIEGAAVQQLWHGHSKNDIVRPDGQVVVKATHRDFKSHVSFFLKVSAEGKITQIDEYDYRTWGEGVAKDEYARIGAISSKDA